MPEADPELLAASGTWVSPVGITGKPPKAEGPRIPIHGKERGQGIREALSRLYHLISNLEESRGTPPDRARAGLDRAPCQDSPPTDWL